MLKAFAGIDTHETSVSVPVFANNQDIPVLAADVDVWLDSQAQLSSHTIGYLIDGHGTYTWANDLASCRRHIEALEFYLPAPGMLRGVWRI